MTGRQRHGSGHVLQRQRLPVATLDNVRDLGEDRSVSNTLALELGKGVPRQVQQQQRELRHRGRGILAVMGIRFRYQLSGVAFAPFFPVERVLELRR